MKLKLVSFHVEFTLENLKYQNIEHLSKILISNFDISCDRKLRIVVEIISRHDKKRDFATQGRGSLFGLWKIPGKINAIFCAESHILD